ncbi:MAG: hypothetical protein GXY44_06205 [Phycisphaerales bacterium]|nr:hypothetical protein [Phycisphaerales bacterium]
MTSSPSSLPPNLVGSILQSHLTQRKTSITQDSARDEQVNAAQRQSKAIDERDTTVETSDEDTRISPDSQGSGGQGRAFTSPEDTAEPFLEEQAVQADDDADEIQHIDIQI